MKFAALNWDITMKIEVKIPLSINDVIDGICPLLKSPIVSYHNFGHEDYAIIRDDDLRLNVSYINGYNLISIDHKKCYNKASQCPIHVSLPLSDRKMERFKKALAFLRTEEGERASATFNWKNYGYDDFDDRVRSEFYRNIG